MNEKPKVLVFNGYYIPAKKYGGPTTSLVSIVEQCSEYFDFYIVAANHDFHEKDRFDNIQDGWNIVGKAHVLYVNLSDYYFNQRAIESLLHKEKPSLVWLVGILVPNDKWFIAYTCRKMMIPYLISPRGEVCDNTFKLKWLKKEIVSRIAVLFKVYRDAYFHATSKEELDGLVKHYEAPRERISLVPNISTSSSAHTRKIEKVQGQLRVVFISRIQEKKNLLDAIRAINQIPFETWFDIYGPIEVLEYWKLCEEAIADAPKNIHIRYCGALNPDEIERTISLYHCFLFPTISENYGHIIAEALAASCPIILSRGTTPWDDADCVAGYTCQLGNIKDFSEKLSLIGRMNQSQYDRLMESTATYFNDKVQQDNSVEGHINMLTNIIGNSMK